MENMSMEDLGEIQSNDYPRYKLKDLYDDSPYWPAAGCEYQGCDDGENHICIDELDFDELCEHIGVHGLRTPLVVQQYKDGSLRLGDGHHRYVAVRALGFTEVPVEILEIDGMP